MSKDQDSDHSVSASDAVAAACATSDPQATAEALSDARIDYIADLIVKGMPDGIQGFCKGWGWRQFARALLKDCCVNSLAEDAHKWRAYQESIALIAARDVERLDAASASGFIQMPPGLSAEESRRFIIDAATEGMCAHCGLPAPGWAEAARRLGFRWEGATKVYHCHAAAD